MITTNSTKSDIWPEDSRWTVILIIIIFTAFFVFYLLTLNRIGYLKAEFFTVDNVKLPFTTMLVKRLKAGHGPVYFSFMWIWIRVFGESEIWMRLPSTLFGFGCVGFVYAILLRHAGRSEAVTASVLLLANTTFLNLSQIARMYTLAAFVMMASTWWILKKEYRPGLWDALILGGLTAVGLHTHYFVGLSVAAQGLYLLVRRKPCWPLIGGLGAGALVSIPWVIWFLSVRPPFAPIKWLPPVKWSSLITLPAALAFDGPSILKTWPWSLLVIALIIILVFYGARHLDLNHLGRFFIFLWIVPVLALTVIMMLGAGNIAQINRYFTHVLVAQTVLTAVGIVALCRRSPGSGWFVFILFCLMSLWPSYKYLSSPDRIDWRKAAETIRTSVEVETPVLVLTSTKKAFCYYYKKPSLHFVALQHLAATEPDKPLDSIILKPGDKRLWIVFDPRIKHWLQRQSIVTNKFYSEVTTHFKDLYPVEESIKIGGLTMLRLNVDQSENPEAK